MLNAEREREFIMKAKSRKAKAKWLLVLVCLAIVVVTVSAKGKSREVVGYIRDSASTLWEMAERHCPNDMDIRDFISEIKKANGMEDSVVYKERSYKIPVYETESDYLDMNTIIGYETSDDGVLLLTSDGNGYFIEK